MKHSIRILVAARNYLDLDQDQVATLSGLNKQTISKIERELNAPNANTMRKLRGVYEDKGIVFTTHGFEYQPYKTSILENFMDILDDIEETLKRGDEVLMHCADERRNLEGVTEKLNQIRQKGIRIRMTCEEGNEFITGKHEDYRWIDKDLFASSQVEVIYADKFYFHFTDAGRHFFVMTKNKEKAKTAKRQFEYQWKRGKEWEDVQKTQQS